MNEKALKKAIKIVGGQSALAQAINEATTFKIAQGHVWNWLNRDHRVPAEYVIPIEKVTNNEVTRHELRPDLYPQEAA